MRAHGNGSGSWPWTGGDEVGRLGDLALDEGIHVVQPFSTTTLPRSERSHRPRSATAAVIALTSVAVAWMLVFFAAWGAIESSRPALGLVIGGILSNLSHPSSSPRARDRLSRLQVLAGVQPRRQLHRDRRRHPVRSASFPSPTVSRAAGAHHRRFAYGFLEDAAGVAALLLPGARARIGSRAAAEKLLSASAVRVDGVARSDSSFRLAGNEQTLEVDIGTAPAGGADATGRRASPSSTKTCTCSRWTSQPAVVCSTLRHQDRRSRDAGARAARTGHRPGGPEDGPGIHPPARPRHTSGLLVVTCSAEAYEAVQCRASSAGASSSASTWRSSRVT